MPIEIELPDGSVAEFPDGTPPGVMQRAVGEHVKVIRQKQHDAVLDGMSTSDKVLAGIGSGMSSVTRALGGGKLLEYFGLPGTKEEADKLDAALMSSRSGRVGNVIGKVAPTLPTVFIPGTNTWTGAAMTGAGVGAATTEGDVQDRLEGAAGGAAGGVGGKALGNLLSRAVRGFVPKTEWASKVSDDVVNASTLGQIADRNTVAGRIASATEEKLKSVPFLGQVVERARDRGAQAWRDDVMRRGTPQGFAPSADKTTRGQLAETYAEFRRRYTDSLRNERVNPSQFFEHQVLKITNNPQSGLSQETGEAIADNVMRNYRSRFAPVPNPAPAGTGVVPAGQAPGVPIAMRGDQAKDLEAFLGDMARRYGKGQSPLDPEMAKMYGELERAWTAAYRRQLGPQVRAKIAPLDERYAPYKTLERAASSVANEGGNFTPAQLVNSVASRTGKAKFGRGEGLLADEAQAGKAMFQDHLANSGTTDRALAIGSLGGLIIDPATTAATYGATAAALPLFTTSIGRRAMTGDTATQLLLQRLRAPQAFETAGRLGIPASAWFRAESELPREDR